MLVVRVRVAAGVEPRGVHDAQPGEGTQGITPGRRLAARGQGHDSAEVQWHRDEREEERLPSHRGQVLAPRHDQGASPGERHRAPPFVAGSGPVGPLWPWSRPRPSRTTRTKTSSSGRFAIENDSIPSPEATRSRSTDWRADGRLEHELPFTIHGLDAVDAGHGVRAPVAAHHHGVIRVLAAEFAHRPVQHHVPAVDHQRAVAQLLDLVHLVGREQHRAARGAALGEDLLEELRVERVEAGEGLVQDQEAGFADERRAELHLLLHALRQRLHLLRGPRCELHPLEQGEPGGACRMRGEALEFPVVDQHVDRRDAPVQAALLGQVGDLPPRIAADAAAVEDDLARVGLEDVGDHADERRLAGAVGSQQGEDLARPDLERHVVHDRPAIEGLDDVADFEHQESPGRAASR